MIDVEANYSTGTGDLKYMPMFEGEIGPPIREMNLRAREAYAVLLTAQWKYGGLPNNLDSLADLAFMGTQRDEFRAVWEQYLRPLFSAIPNGRPATARRNQKC